MKKRILPVFLIVLSLFLPFSAASFAEGEGNGEESWTDRYFYHYEFIPYVNGTELPRTVYRNIGTLGEQTIASSIGSSTFTIDKFRNNETMNGRANKRDSLSYFDSRSLYRSDVFIFCDFAVKYSRSYVIENYPYRDHHFHHYYYETPVSIAGFGSESSVDTGNRSLKRIFIDRSMLSAFVADFNKEMLVPWASQFGNNPRGERKVIRQWSDGWKPGGSFGDTGYPRFGGVHTAYVWKLDYDKTNFGFWNFFDESTLEAVSGASEMEQFFRNKDAIERARKELEKKVSDEEKAGNNTKPDWIKLALENKIAISPETVEGYNFVIESTERGRDVFRMEASRLDDYFPQLDYVMNILSKPGLIMAQEAMENGAGKYAWGTFDGRRILPPWNSIAYDSAMTSGPGSWICWDKEKDSFTFQLFSDDASVLAHWLYGDANRTLYGRYGIGTGIIDDKHSDKKNFENIIDKLAGNTGDIRAPVVRDLSIPTSQKALYGVLRNSRSLLISAIEDAKNEQAKNVWADSFARNNTSSPWKLLKDIFPETYNAIVPWTSLSLGLTFLDAGNSTAWKRGIQFNIKPTAIFYASADEPVSGSMNHVREITGIPAKYDDGTSFTDSHIKEIVRDWPLETTFKNHSYDNTALIRYGTTRYFPVDLAYSKNLASALSGAMEIKVETISDKELDEAFSKLFGEKDVSSSFFGLGKYDKAALELFKDSPENYLPNWNLDDKRDIEFYRNFGKDSFHWNWKVPLYRAPKEDDCKT